MNEGIRKKARGSRILPDLTSIWTIEAFAKQKNYTGSAIKKPFRTYGGSNNYNTTKG